jgi:hypothetical protein
VGSWIGQTIAAALNVSLLTAYLQTITRDGVADYLQAAKFF